jgi:Uma2 family endonuclease
LEFELASETRSEYRNGEIILMTGDTPEHNRISGNLYIALSLTLRRNPYEVFHVDQRLSIPSRNLYSLKQLGDRPAQIKKYC